MAVVIESGGAELHGGSFSALALSQYKALAAVRWSMFRNSLRSPLGALEQGARTVAFLFYALLGVGMAAGFGGGAYAILSSGKWEMLPLLFWVLFVLWQVVPITIASFQEHFELGGLLRFPVAFSAFCLLHLVFGLVDASTIMGALCCLGVWIGIVVARPDLLPWAALALAGFAAFNILLVRAIAAWLDRWLAQRRTREIVGALFFVGLLSLQLLNPAFHTHMYAHLSAQSREEGRQALAIARQVQRWLPPGLAASGIERGGAAMPTPALEAILLLGLYAAGAGGVLGVRLHAEYRGENLGDAPARKKAERQSRTWLIDGSGPIGAVMEKELRVLLRALPLIYSVVAPLLLVFVLSDLFLKHGATPGHAPAMSLMVALAYGIVGFTQLLYNNLGPEGAGIQLLFLSPTPIRTVIFAKNLFHTLLFLVDAVLICMLSSMRLGWPSIPAMAATAAWLLFALPAHLTAGNLLSLHMPYRMNLGRMNRQRGSQANSLFSMLIQAVVLGIGAGIFALCSLFADLWLAIPILLVLAAGAAFAWLQVLRRIDRMAEKQRETLIAILAKTE